MANLEAKEIERQSSRLREQLGNFGALYTTVYRHLDIITNLVKSEDSELSNTLVKYSQTYQNLGNSLYKNFWNLSTIMNDYVYATLKNESNAEYEMKNIEQQIEDLNSMFRTMNVFAVIRKLDTGNMQQYYGAYTPFDQISLGGEYKPLNVGGQNGIRK